MHNKILVRNSSLNSTTCERQWKKIWDSGEYAFPISDSLMTTFCVLGCILNLVTLVIFRRKDMKNPTNFIFSALAISDFLSTLRKLQRPVVNIFVDDRRRPEYGFVVEDLVNWILYMTFHTLSIYLTVTVAIWRYIGLRYPLRGRKSTNKSIMAIFVAFSSTLAVVAAMFVNVIIGPKPILFKNDTMDGNNVSKIENFEWILRGHLGWHIFHLIHGLLIQIVPSLILAVVSVEIVVSIMRSNASRKKLFHSSTITRPPQLERGASVERQKQEKMEMDRTGATILTVLVISLVTTLPTGIISMVRAVSSKNSTTKCTFASEVWLDNLEYINNGTNFFVYLITGRKFRRNVKDMATTYFKLLAHSTRWRLGARHGDHSQLNSSPAATTWDL